MKIAKRAASGERRMRIVFKMAETLRIPFLGQTPIFNHVSPPKIRSAWPYPVRFSSSLLTSFIKNIHIWETPLWTRSQKTWSFFPFNQKKQSYGHIVFLNLQMWPLIDTITLRAKLAPSLNIWRPTWSILLFECSTNSCQNETHTGMTFVLVSSEVSIEGEYRQWTTGYFALSRRLFRTISWMFWVKP